MNHSDRQNTPRWYRSNRLPIIWTHVFVLLSCGLGLHAQEEQGAAAEEAPVFQLDPFLVESREDSYTQTQANTGTIVAMARDKIPFTTSVVTSQLIEDMRLDNPADLSEQIAGVSRDLNPYVGDVPEAVNGLSYRVRGFVSPPLYNGFQTGRRILSPDNVGRIEVSKGPNAVLYGQAPAGGIINFIPKNPQYESHASFLVGAGSNGWRRSKFDVGGPIDVQKVGKAAAVRFGGSWLEFEREQPYFQSEVSNLHGAFTWQLNDRITLDLQGEFNTSDVIPSRTAAFVSTGSGPDRVIDPYNRLRNSRNFTYDGPHSSFSTENYVTTIYLTANLMENLTFRVGGIYTEQDELYDRLDGTFGLSNNETVTGNYEKADVDRKTHGIKGDLVHTLNWRSMEVQSLVGVETHFERNHNTKLEAGAVTVTIPFDREQRFSDWPERPRPDAYTLLDTWEETQLDWTNIRFTQIYSAFDDDATFMWGVARGEGDTTTNDFLLGEGSRSESQDTTYTVGGTVSILEGDEDAFLNDAIVFANYATSFEIQSGNQQDPNQFDGFPTVDALREYIRNLSPNSMEPQTGDGFEIGLRLGLMKDTLDLTVTYFDQTRENIARSFFVRESRVAGVDSENGLATFQLAGGEENAKGIEFALSWRPVDNFVLTGEATFMDGEVVKNEPSPEEEGFGLVRSPDEMVSFWARYDFTAEQTPVLEGLSLGIGASYNSSTRIRPQVPDRFRVSDDYTMVRALIRYRFTAFNLEHQLSLNIDNLLDDDYTQEDNFLSEPRLFKLTYSLDL